MQTLKREKQKIKGGYFWKILWVDLDREVSKVLEFDESFASKYIGGRGFGAKLVWDNLAKHGFQIAGGQGELKGKIIRFSHMGYVDAFDTLGVLAALEMTLIGQGFKLAPGAGLAAAQKVFAEAMK